MQYIDLYSKIVTPSQFLTWQDQKLPPSRIVFTNGCFDLLHPGHVDYLQKASANGDLLVVGLNSDLSVQKIKGAGRPVQNQNARAVILAALHSVDFVIIFNEQTPLKLIETIQPHVLVKGGDWPLDRIIGREIVEKNGGSVLTIPLLPGYSTTKLIEKILSSKADTK